jgi:hypothetical protein
MISLIDGALPQASAIMQKSKNNGQCHRVTSKLFGVKNISPSYSFCNNPLIDQPMQSSIEYGIFV